MRQNVSVHTSGANPRFLEFGGIGPAPTYADHASFKEAGGNDGAGPQKSLTLFWLHTSFPPPHQFAFRTIVADRSFHATLLMLDCNSANLGECLNPRHPHLGSKLVSLSLAFHKGD